ncbi:MAG: GNAT family N-acetyltransferase [Chlorobia bacterium]|nr:GNAT family N-acetyltransferase [Fimbriimonadaceae bacterium]
MKQIELLAQIRDSLVEGLSPGRIVERVGGFVYLRHASDSMKWLNQTIPVGPVTEANLDSLLVRYRETDRVPFFEFFPDLAPNLPTMLEAHGLTKFNEMPIMTLRRSDWSKKPYEEQAHSATFDDLKPGFEALSEAFGGPLPGGTEELWRAMETGRILAAVGYCGDEIVAMGQAVGTREIRELAGIGTRAAWRRQGFAAAVIESLLDQHFSSGGVLAWLTPGDDGAESVYSGCGFKSVGKQVCYGVPD